MKSMRKAPEFERRLDIRLILSVVAVGLLSFTGVTIETALFDEVFVFGSNKLFCYRDGFRDVGPPFLDSYWRSAFTRLRNGDCAAAYVQYCFGTGTTASLRGGDGDCLPYVCLGTSRRAFARRHVGAEMGVA